VLVEPQGCLVKPLQILQTLAVVVAVQAVLVIM